MAVSTTGRVGRINDIDMSDDGTRAALMWDQQDAGGTEHQARFRLWRDNTWRKPAGVSEPSPTPANPRFALSDDGRRAVAVWMAWNRTNDGIQASSWNGRTWATPTDVSEEGLDAQLPQVSVAANGLRAIAVWSRFGDIQARSLAVTPDGIRKARAMVKNRQVQLTWLRDRNATAYLIKAIRDGTPTTKRVVTTTQSRLRAKPGRYQVRIQGKAPTGLGPAATLRFRVR